MDDESPLLSSQAVQGLSKFTYRHLHVLSTASPAKESPLRVVALCDLDCFYAQVEGVRVKADPDEPLAVSQWGGLIAINYAARAKGITRHENAISAIQKCPGIRLVHVQTWKEGDTVAKYHDDPTVIDHKVSLDPYRRESRKILEIFKKHCAHVEKASIDESFLDLSTLVKEKLIERFSHLLDMDNKNWDRPLPEPPFAEWSSGSGVLVPLNAGFNEEDGNDWDDLVMLIAAETMAVIRQDVKDTLGYTCSAGIARNKTLAKLAAGSNKPAKQTILRNRAVQSFLDSLPFNKIRNLGGKLGSEVEKIFEMTSVKEITELSIHELRAKLGSETGQWLWNIVRGIDYSEVSTSTQVKSMLSAKSFRPQIDSIAQAERWIKVLTADLASRLLEDPNQRRPKTMTVHHRIPGASKARQIQIPRGHDLTNEYLANLGMKLLLQISTEGRAFPCFNLSFGLSGFEGLESGVQDIGGFFRKSTIVPISEVSAEQESGVVDARLAQSVSDVSPHLIHASSDAQSSSLAEPVSALNSSQQADTAVLKHSPTSSPAHPLSHEPTHSSTHSPAPGPEPAPPSPQTIPNDGSFLCDKCKKSIVGETQDEHADWHFAVHLSTSLRQHDRTQPQTQTQTQTRTTAPLRSARGGTVTGRSTLGGPTTKQKAKVETTRGRNTGSATAGTSGGTGGGTGTGAGTVGPSKRPKEPVEKGQKRLKF